MLLVTDNLKSSVKGAAELVDDAINITCGYVVVSDSVVVKWFPDIVVAPLTDGVIYSTALAFISVNVLFRTSTEPKKLTRRS